MWGFKRGCGGSTARTQQGLGLTDIEYCGKVVSLYMSRMLIMHLSNFTITNKINMGEFNARIFAMVDVTTGFLWWRKTDRCEIKRYVNDKCWKLGDWHFTDTFELLPSMQMKNFEDDWIMKHGEL